MKKGIIHVLIVAMLLGSSSRLWAQDSSAASSATTPPAQAAGIVGLVQMAAGAIKALKAKICACPCGQFIQNMTKPLNLMLGGMLCPPCCPPISDADKKMPSTTPQGACAKIMQEEMEMPARRKAVQCLARVDCHWFPEAEAALITALRADVNECVRLEAAMVLGNGCCCTKRIIEALTITVTGSKKDGNPSENSERVKSAALGSLLHCLSCYVEEVEEQPRPEKPPDKAPPGKPPAEKPPVAGFKIDGSHLTYYYEEIKNTPPARILENSRKVAVAANTLAPAGIAANPVISSTNNGRNVMQLWMSAQNGAISPIPAREPVTNTLAVAAPPQRIAPVPRTPSVLEPPTSPISPATITFEE